jgi:putative peptide maturation dehydrogenase
VAEPSRPKFRRSKYAFYYLAEPDPRALLSAEWPVDQPQTDVWVLALLTGHRHRLRPEQFRLLRSVPGDDWVPLVVGADDGADELVHLGVLLSDSDDERVAALRRRDEALAATAWNRYAAAFHFMTQWSNVDLRGEAEQLELGPESRAAAREYVQRHGPPPAASPEPRDGPSVELPRPHTDGALYRTLLARRTTRAFDTDAAMTAEQLATVLHWVFGCHGYGRNVADVECIKRTSPSGGALHPIEAYPVVTGIDGVAPAIYHYDARRHVLETLSALDRAEGRALASRLMAGQHYFGDAHVSIVLTARFYRNHWKYRGHQKAYPGMLMDAAHLSQTLYLVATELGLGAFVTLAINGRDIEERLGLDGIEEGVIAMCGCGVRAAGDSPLEIRFAPADDHRG